MNTIEVFCSETIAIQLTDQFRHVRGGDEVGVSAVDHSADVDVFSLGGSDKRAAKFGDVAEPVGLRPGSNTFVH